MNERFELNSEAVRAWLRMEDRKQIHLVRKLGISQSLVAQMLNDRHVPKEDTLNDLARLMGVEVAKLLIPKGSLRSA